MQGLRFTYMTNLTFIRYLWEATLYSPLKVELIEILDYFSHNTGAYIIYPDLMPVIGCVSPAFSVESLSSDFFSLSLGILLSGIFSAEASASGF